LPHDGASSTFYFVLFTFYLPASHLASMADGLFPPNEGATCPYSPRAAHLASMANGAFLFWGEVVGWGR
jgi:hypothetical protein